MQKPFQGFRTFLKAPIEDETRPITVLGIPFDCATSNRPGARFGPAAIREASLMLTDGEHPVHGINPCNFVTDIGDIPVSNTDTAKSLIQIESFLSSNKFTNDKSRQLITMGGDHTITLAILRHLRTLHGEPLGVIHFDAHCDTWDDHFGDPLGHGTWVKNAIEEGLVETNAFTSIGIRSAADRDARDYLYQHGGRTISPETFYGHYTPRSLIDYLEPFYKNRLTYISFDIDCLDPAYAPGTGTPEMGGMSSLDIKMIFNSLARSSFNFVGMDVVEVSPPYDHAQLTSLAAATLAWTYAAMVSPLDSDTK